MHCQNWHIKNFAIVAHVFRINYQYRRIKKKFNKKSQGFETIKMLKETIRVCVAESSFY